MYFDGASSCEGAKVGVLFVAPKNEFIIRFSYRLRWDIDYTNNVCKYEALFLGLKAGRKLKIENMIVYGDAELIMKQIKQQYQDKHPRLRSDKKYSSDLIEIFFSSFNIHHIPTMEN